MDVFILLLGLIFDCYCCCLNLLALNVVRDFVSHWRDVGDDEILTVAIEEDVLFHDALWGLLTPLDQILGLVHLVLGTLHCLGELFLSFLLCGCLARLFKSHSFHEFALFNKLKTAVSGIAKLSQQLLRLLV